MIDSAVLHLPRRDKGRENGENNHGSGSLRALIKKSLVLFPSANTRAFTSRPFECRRRKPCRAPARQIMSVLICTYPVRLMHAAAPISRPGLGPTPPVQDPVSHSFPVR